MIEGIEVVALPRDPSRSQETRYQLLPKQRVLGSIRFLGPDGPLPEEDCFKLLQTLQGQLALNGSADPVFGSYLGQLRQLGVPEQGEVSLKVDVDGPEPGYELEGNKVVVKQWLVVASE